MKETQCIKGDCHGRTTISHSQCMEKGEETHFPQKINLPIITTSCRSASSVLFSLRHFHVLPASLPFKACFPDACLLCYFPQCYTLYNLTRRRKHPETLQSKAIPINT